MECSSPVTGVTIRPMSANDISDVVRTHLDSFPGFFLTFLGPGFLRVLYSELLRTSDHVALVAEDEKGRLLGFVVGVADQQKFYSRLARRRWWAFALASAGAVLRNPRIVPRLIRALGNPSRSGGAATRALLMSLAVSPRASGRGIGSRITTLFLAEMKRRGVRAVGLTTDAFDNEKANRFYLGLGFTLTQSHSTPEGRLMNEFVKELE